MKRRLVLALAVLLGVSAAGADARLVRVMTWNVGLLRVLGSDYVPLVRERAPLLPERVAAAVRELAPDLLVLEEVWDPRHAEAVRSVLVSEGYTVVRPTARGGLLGLTSGLILGVRAPLIVRDWVFERFGANTFMEGFARKGVLSVAVETPEGLRIDVLATHMVALDTVDGEPDDAAQVRIFRRQADQILSTLAHRTRGGATPAIILGDFNVGPGYADAEYRRIADAPGVAEAGELARPGDAFITWDPENPLVKHGEYPNEPPAKIDHVFLVRGGGMGWAALSAELVMRESVAGLVLTPKGATQGVPAPFSDHYGFLAVVSLEPAGPE